MAKFRVSVKVEKLEIEVEGSREDMPLIADSVGQQFVGLLQPAAQIAGGEPADRRPASPEPTIVQASNDGKRRTSRKRRSVTTTVAGGTPGAAVAADAPLRWRHDTGRWGTPKKDWTLGNKCLYLMYVAKVEANQGDLTAATIATTFNQLFKQSGTLKTKYVTQELGRLKGRENPPVSEDATQSPTLWFLTPTGVNEARALVAEVLGRTPDAVSGEGDEVGAGASA